MLLLSCRELLIVTCIVFSFLAACSEHKVNYDRDNAPPVPLLEFDPELKPYFDSYVADAADAGVPVSDANLKEFKGIMWADKLDLRGSGDDKILGLCRRRLDLSYVELLRPNSERMVGFTFVDDLTLKMMVYHELGHCLHGFSGHTSGKSAAIMNSNLQPARYLDPDGLLHDHFQMMKKFRENPMDRPYRE